MKYLVGIATTVDKAFDASVLLDDRGFVYVSFGQEGPTREVFVLTRGQATALGKLLGNAAEACMFCAMAGEPPGKCKRVAPECESARDIRCPARKG